MCTHSWAIALIKWFNVNVGIVGVRFTLHSEKSYPLSQINLILCVVGKSQQHLIAHAQMVTHPESNHVQRCLTLVIYFELDPFNMPLIGGFMIFIRKIKSKNFIVSSLRFANIQVNVHLIR
jgi:hypothetical protein